MSVCCLFCWIVSEGGFEEQTKVVKTHQLTILCSISIVYIYSAAAAEAAEAAIGNVLDDVGVDVHSHQATVHTDAHAEALGHMEAAAAEMHAGGATEEDEVALAAAAAAAAVQAADGMAVVVDQAVRFCSCIYFCLVDFCGGGGKRNMNMDQIKVDKKLQRARRTRMQIEGGSAA